MLDVETQCKRDQLALPGYWILLSRPGDNSQTSSPIVERAPWEQPRKQKRQGEEFVEAVITQTCLFGGDKQFRILVLDDANVWTEMA